LDRWIDDGSEESEKRTYWLGGSPVRFEREDKREDDVSYQDVDIELS